MIPANYHLHSSCSFDSRSSVLQMCEAALAAGFTDVCFTEHLDFDRDDPGYGYFDYEATAAAIAEAQHRCAGRLQVRLGIEVDFRRAYGSEPREVLDAMEPDFLLGAVHSVAGVTIYKLNAEPADAVERMDIRWMQGEYFDEVEALVECGWCHGLAHFDYLYKQWPAIFGRYRDAWYWGRVERILAACVERRIALEVNSQHVMDRGLGLAADEEILKRYRRLGGRLLTVGSDAHGPAGIAHGYAPMEQAVREAGFAAVTGFEAGQPYPIAIP